jgi:hypothetical protein
MRTYLVEVEKNLVTEVEVEAENREEAREKAIKMCQDEPAWWTGVTEEYDALVFG